MLTAGCSFVGLVALFFKQTFAFAVACLAQSIEELEKEMLKGQKLQGPATAAEVYLILKHKNLVDK